jgi:small neutral amino acid transporter SnatA (MarC family)
MALTALGGPKIFGAAGIAIEAFNIVGDLMPVVVCFDMLRAEDPEIAVSEDKDEEIDHLPKKQHRDIAVAPLAMPIIAGPET